MLVPNLLSAGYGFVIVAEDGPSLELRGENDSIFSLCLYLWCHKSVWRHFSTPSKCPHPCSRDKVKVLLSVGIKEGHGLVLGVVGGNLEGDDLQLREAGGHAEHLAPVGRLVDVPLGWVRVRHPCGVSAHNVEVGSRGHSGLGVPLDLCRTWGINKVIFWKMQNV